MTGSEHGGTGRNKSLGTTNQSKKTIVGLLCIKVKSNWNTCKNIHCALVSM